MIFVMFLFWLSAFPLRNVGVNSPMVTKIGRQWKITWKIENKRHQNIILSILCKETLHSETKDVYSQYNTFYVTIFSFSGSVSIMVSVPS